MQDGVLGFEGGYAVDEVGACAFLAYTTGLETEVGKVDGGERSVGG